MASYRDEKDSMGSCGSRRMPTTGPRPKGGGEFSHRRPQDAPGADPRAGPDQALRGRGQPAAGLLEKGLSDAVAARRVRFWKASSTTSSWWASSRPARHLHQHEPQRGHRLAGNEILTGKKGGKSRSTQRPRQPRTVEQRRGPSAIHIAALVAIRTKLAPALRRLHQALAAKADEFADVRKIAARTSGRRAHDLGQEFSGYARQVELGSNGWRRGAPLAELAWAARPWDRRERPPRVRRPSHRRNRARDRHRLPPGRKPFEARPAAMQRWRPAGRSRQSP